MQNLRYENVYTIKNINMSFHCLIENQLNDMDPRFLPDSDPNKAEWPFHFHEYMELIYGIKGRVIAFINDEQYTLGPDDLLIVFPLEPHRYTSLDGNGFSYGVMKFYPTMIYNSKSQTEFDYLYNLNNANHSRLFKDLTCVKDAFIKSADAFREKSYAFDIVIPGCIFQVCSEILKAWHQKNEILQLNVPKQNVSIFYNLINLIIEQRGRLTAAEAAEYCHFSYGYFARMFKSIFNTDYKSYARNVKIDEAKRLLICTNNTITEIAADLGYSSASHFIKDFKLITNISPKQYRNSLI